MATIKMCTDIPQSEILSKILPHKSADMFIDCNNPYYIHTELKHIEHFDSEHYPCWSLAALLDILDFSSLTQNKEDEWEVCVPNYKSNEYIEVSAVNPVDACVEMIKQLKESDLL